MSDKKDLHDALPPLLNVDNMAEGAIYELMGKALTDVADNIMDPNTSEKQKRKIKLVFEATPYPDRSGFSYDVKVETNLAGMRPATGTAYIAKKNGQHLVVGKNHKQQEIEFAAAEPRNGDSKPV